MARKTIKDIERELEFLRKEYENKLNDIVGKIEEKKQGERKIFSTTISSLESINNSLQEQLKIKWNTLTSVATLITVVVVFVGIVQFYEATKINNLLSEKEQKFQNLENKLDELLRENEIVISQIPEIIGAMQFSNLNRHGFLLEETEQIISLIDQERDSAEVYRNILELAREMRCRSFFRLGEFAELETESIKLVNDSPQNWKGYHFAGLARLERGLLDSLTLNYFNESLEKNTKDNIDRINLAEYHLFEENYGEVINQIYGFIEHTKYPSATGKSLSIFFYGLVLMIEEKALREFKEEMTAHYNKVSRNERYKNLSEVLENKHSHQDVVITLMEEISPNKSIRSYSSFALKRFRMEKLNEQNFGSNTKNLQELIDRVINKAEVKNEIGSQLSYGDNPPASG